MLGAEVEEMLVGELRAAEQMLNAELVVIEWILLDELAVMGPMVSVSWEEQVMVRSKYVVLFA